MAEHGKKYREAASKVPDGIAFDEPAQALELVKDTAHAGFDETVDLAVRLGVDPRHADQIVRGTVVLPHGTGRTVRVLVFAEGDAAREAEEAGADFVGMEYVERVEDGWLDVDAVVAAPDVMGRVGPLGRILGPRGLMPSPKAGTVTPDVGDAVRDIKAGKIEFRVDRTGNLHVPIGRVSFPVDELTDNLGAFMTTVLDARPAAAKGAYVRTVAVSSTMGPSVRIDANLYRQVTA